MSELSVRQQNHNIARLAAAQALAGANSVVFYATGAVVGSTLAPFPSLATLPVSVFVIGMAASILPLGYLAKRLGRKAVFMTGTAAGVLTGLLASIAVSLGSFWLFCLAASFGGCYAAVALSFRFAAIEGVAKSRQAQALSLVMGGGVLAGITGPTLVNETMSLWPDKPFAITFLAQAAVALCSALILAGVKTIDARDSKNTAGRPLAEIVRQPGFSRTVFSAAVSYMVMNFLMTAAPLSMHMQGISQHYANLGIQWHVIAMYGPGFFTGRLITRYGAKTMTTLGLIIFALSMFAGLSGNDVSHYWLSLILLGLGWNFSFTGASAQIVNYHRPEEKNRVQSLNDFVVFGVMIVGTFSSGALLNAFGWNAVLWGSLCAVALALIAMLKPSQDETL